MYSNIQVGDEVVLVFRGDESLRKVTKVTKTRFEVNGFTFTKIDGLRYGSSSFYSARVRLATDDDKIRLLQIQNRTSMIDKLRTFDYKKLDTETLEKLYKIVETKA